MISEWTSSHTKREAMVALNDIGVPCGAVLDTAEILEDPHLRARNMVVDLDDENRGRYPVLGCARSRSAPVPSPSPRHLLLGEHSEEVLSTLLGINEKDLDRLAGSGVI